MHRACDIILPTYGLKYCHIYFSEGKVSLTLAKLSNALFDETLVFCCF